MNSFWNHLPGVWRFERFLYGQLLQDGLLGVDIQSEFFYKVHENGTYKAQPEQTFFRNFSFRWEDDSINIYGANPKDGYVFLHRINDLQKSHTHLCKADKYIFNLLEMSPEKWSSKIKINGPKKDLELITLYYRQ